MQSQQDVYDSLFILMVNESIQYIFSKKLDKKTQKQEIEELGIQLGEKVTNNLLNSDKSRVTLEKNSVYNYFQFITKNVWEFIFQDQNCQLTKENEGANYLITSGDIKLYNYLVTEKGNQNDAKLEAILNFICGIIKGALNVFNIECIVSPNVTSYSKQLVRDFKNFPDYYSYIFTFNINVFTDNSDADMNKNLA
jgi:hypothetical protein